MLPTPCPMLDASAASCPASDAPALRRAAAAPSAAPPASKLARQPATASGDALSASAIARLAATAPGSVPSSSRRTQRPATGSPPAPPSSKSARRAAPASTASASACAGLGARARPASKTARRPASARSSSRSTPSAAPAWLGPLPSRSAMSSLLGGRGQLQGVVRREVAMVEVPKTRTAFDAWVLGSSTLLDGSLPQHRSMSRSMCV